MSQGSRQLFPDQNPFRTAAVKPGALPFCFPSGVIAQSLVDRLKANDWRGEIVGSHGSGKSTLVQTLLPQIEAEGRRVRIYVARPNQRPFPFESSEADTWTDATLVVFEGYELLSRRQKGKLDTLCNRHNSGLLITAHASQSMPLIYTTRVTLEIARLVVGKLLPDECDLIQSQDVLQAFSQHKQDLRELLFEMYDLYEARRSW